MTNSCSLPGEPCGDPIAVVLTHAAMVIVAVTYVVASILVFWRRHRTPMSLRPWPLVLLCCFGVLSNWGNSWFWATQGTDCSRFSRSWGWANVHLIGGPISLSGLRLWLKHRAERQKLLWLKAELTPEHLQHASRQLFLFSPLALFLYFAALVALGGSVQFGLMFTGVPCKAANTYGLGFNLLIYVAMVVFLVTRLRGSRNDDALGLKKELSTMLGTRAHPCRRQCCFMC